MVKSGELEKSEDRELSVADPRGGLECCCGGGGGRKRMREYGGEGEDLQLMKAVEVLSAWSERSGNGGLMSEADFWTWRWGGKKSERGRRNKQCRGAVLFWKSRNEEGVG